MFKETARSKNQGLQFFSLCTLFITSLLLSIFYINPIGDFPLNDDWSMGIAVKNLLDLGRVKLSGWTSMSLIAQIFGGYLFCLPFGFSFTALRIFTLLFSFIGIFSTYKLIYELKKDRNKIYLLCM